MAGGNRHFTYTADSGQKYAIFLDKSNTLAVNSSGYEWTTSDPVAKLPRNIKPRTLTYASPDGLRRIRAVALDPAKFASAPMQIPDPLTPNQNLNLIQKVPEIMRGMPRAQDTGLQG
uniref:hypothetical protein n=1 Tax=Synechococcus sp. TaxID=1131 RepID=UPI000166005A|nr:hypothetical protein [Synechococcus sp.]